jgi:hypothetical protein
MNDVVLAYSTQIILRRMQPFTEARGKIMTEERKSITFSEGSQAPADESADVLMVRSSGLRQGPRDLGFPN